MLCCVCGLGETKVFLVTGLSIQTALHRKFPMLAQEGLTSMSRPPVFYITAGAKGVSCFFYWYLPRVLLQFMVSTSVGKPFDFLVLSRA